MKDDQNFSYNGGGVAYLLQSVDILFNSIVDKKWFYITKQKSNYYLVDAEQEQI